MTGTVFNIQKFCTGDGPGIRTVVFLKGCPLHCAWCHNAESQRSVPELLYHGEKCTLCGRCVSACKMGVHLLDNGAHILMREKCTVCGECTKACLNDALEIKGKEMSASDVLAEVMKDKPFYESSGGGITLSGGEPLAQIDFTLELLTEAKAAGLHTCVETCGYTKRENIERVARLTDIFLFDVKLTDSALHQKYTGVPSEQILENLRAIDELGAKTILRCPIIPDVNDNEEHFAALAKLANSLTNVLRIELEPYHAFGNGKYEQVGRGEFVKEFRVPEENEPQKWCEQVRAHTSVPVLVP